MARIDLGKVVGERGERGTLIYSGTAITGKETEGIVFAESGIEYALQEDKYLNTITNDMYTCITEGDAETAEWAWIGNIQGKPGIPGDPGPTGKVDEKTPIDFEMAKTNDNIESGESLSVLFGKSEKLFSEVIAMIAALNGYSIRVMSEDQYQQIEEKDLKTIYLRPKA